MPCPLTQRNSLNISKRELDEILTELEATQTQDSVNERAHQRVPFRVLQASLTLINGNHSETEIMVATSNISQGGIAILHASFIHLKTRCRVKVDLADGRTLKLAGQIVRCTFIKGKIHEVGIQFDKPISSK